MTEGAVFPVCLFLFYVALIRELPGGATREGKIRTGQRAIYYGSNRAENAFPSKNKPKISPSPRRELPSSRGKPKSEDRYIPPDLTGLSQPSGLLPGCLTLGAEADLVKLSLRGESVPGQLCQRSSDHYGTLSDGDPTEEKASGLVRSLEQECGGDLELLRLPQ